MGVFREFSKRKKSAPDGISAATYDGTEGSALKLATRLGAGYSFGRATIYASSIPATPACLTLFNVTNGKLRDDVSAIVLHPKDKLCHDNDLKGYEEFYVVKAADFDENYVS